MKSDAAKRIYIRKAVKTARIERIKKRKRADMLTIAIPIGIAILSVITQKLGLPVW